MFNNNCRGQPLCGSALDNFVKIGLILVIYEFGINNINFLILLVPKS